MKELQKKLVCRREESDCALAAAERRRDDVRSGDACGQHTEGTGPSSCGDLAAADAGKAPKNASASQISSSCRRG